MCLFIVCLHVAASEESRFPVLNCFAGKIDRCVTYLPCEHSSVLRRMLADVSSLNLVPGLVETIILV